MLGMRTLKVWASRIVNRRYLPDRLVEDRVVYLATQAHQENFGSPQAKA